MVKVIFIILVIYIIYKLFLKKYFLKDNLHEGHTIDKRISPNKVESINDPSIEIIHGKTTIKKKISVNITLMIGKILFNKFILFW